MRSNAPPATPEEIEYMLLCKSLGCLACWRLEPPLFTYAEFDHFKRGNKRIGRTCGCALCPWHHRGVLIVNQSFAWHREHYGPSKAEGSKPFHTKFGSEQFLLDMQQSIITKGPPC
jgi:hypothetical protein